ncbi:MAG TPA: bifunctional DNA-formamidopyrimidine glycosylase/DNA-(apurinic or apyrimidinic site) lyase [Pyrinomonadaceae bacterium]|nr:bifunctional DNA-formamidopyrimidine glycosylase/DNA-(apurinic or apyrimidinic site) lyase [Pyrinomonadaceae bacterium]
MPELPEVELVARALDRLITGQRISAARLLRPGLAPETAPQIFARRLRDHRIESIGRRGKHILINLDRALVLVVHLRMTGRFLYLPIEAALPKHTHAIFYLDNERRLVFTDQRHFGMMKLIHAAQLSGAKELRSLAPEPFSDDFTPDYLHAALSRSRRTLKDTLLDQTRVVGLGNIYAAEALHIAHINPFATAATLSRRRSQRLHRAILDVLTEAIAHGSTMNVDPEDIEGSYYGGGYEGHWRVYDREGEPCPACRARVHRLMHNGRSTFFCPRCQKS